MSTPTFSGAAYGGESVTLVSADAELVLHRRTTGWGWGELARAGEVLGVLDHLGELAVRDSAVPMRLEAQEAVTERTELGRDRVRLEVESVTTAAALSGSSFEQWVGAPFAGPLITGTVTITADGRGGFDLGWRLESRFDIFATYLRGPWLRVGQGSFGAERDDAILPGIEWCVGDEWSSGDDSFRDPWAMRAVPPVDSVAVPVMAVSRRGTVVTVEWDPTAEATGWFSMPREHAQPVFASPNFIERNDSSLLGIMLPQSRTGRGDAWRASEPLELHRGQVIELDARIAASAGDSLDGVADWVQRHGMPEPSPQRWPIDETLHRIADAYSTGLWHDGDGFGAGQTPGDVSPRIPSFAGGYLARYPDAPAAAALRERIESLGDRALAADRQNPVAAARELLAAQQPDGSFRFDPAGRHRSKDDFVVARDLVAPMGQAGDAALDLDVLPAITLLRAHDSGGDARFAEAARSALDHARRFRRPEGGDFWETPLHAPNLLAAGHGAVAYALSWERFGREEDRVSARRWLRSLLVFTHLWSPAERPMLYNTKPCLCSSDWYFANWVRDHVQWEVLGTFALAAELDVDLAAVDPELDWRRYHAGITTAAVRWLLDHTDDRWRPHNLPATLELYRAGRFDMCLPDTHNSTTGLYGGMAIPPDAVAVNLLALG